MGSVVESPVTYRRRITQSALHLIRDRKSSEQRRAIGVRELSGREHRAKVVRGVTRFMRGEIAVVEIEVADERAVVQRGAIGCAPTTADEGTVTVMGKIRHELPHATHGVAIECSKCAPDRV